MVVDFRRKKPHLQPVSIEGVDVEVVRTYKYMGQWQREGPWTNCCPYWTTPTTLCTTPSPGREVCSVADCCPSPAPPIDKKTILSPWPSDCTTAPSKGREDSRQWTIYISVFCTSICTVFTFICTVLLPSALSYFHLHCLLSAPFIAATVNFILYFNLS